jgi:hypothetical protein
LTLVACGEDEDPGRVEVFVAGENVVCDGGTCGGEGIGQATLDLDPDSRSVCYDIELEDIPEPTALHIHSGELAEAGPVVLDLEWQGDSAEGEGCLEGVDVDLLRRIIDDKRGHFLQVHSERYPDGAARGHLST